jgi:hypothetical protein
MVFGVSLVPSIMGCHDGTMELCLAPDVDTTSAFYGGLFWIYSSHSIFQSGRKCPTHALKLAWYTLAKLKSFLKLGSTILTLISSIMQLACLIWYLVSYFPMGSSG